MRKQKMRVLKSATTKLKSAYRKALKEGKEVEVRWNLTSRGNVKFDGWEKERGTWYHEITAGFMVQGPILGEYGVYCHPNSHEYKSIPQDILEELYSIEIDVLEF